MIYRIRYRRHDGHDDAEVVVEANSPTEAVVKFQHAANGPRGSAREVVTSVRAEDNPCDLSL